MTNREDNDTFWDQYSNHIVVGVFILIATIMIVFWLYTLQITNGMVPDSAKVGNQPSLPGNTASLGDSYGATNALFSGLAMVAAITAIAIQTFEFRYQRKELSITNDTHRERLEFDRRVHAYERRLQIIAMFQRYHDDELREAANSLCIDPRPHGYSFQDTYRAAFDPGWANEFIREESDHHKVDTFNLLVSDIQRGDRFLIYINDLSLMDLSDEELARWNGILKPLRGVLDRALISVAKSSQSIRPLWVTGVQDIVNRIQDGPR